MRPALAMRAAASKSSTVTRSGFMAVCGLLARADATILRIARPSRPTHSAAQRSNCGEQMATQRVPPQHLLHLQRTGREALAHIWRSEERRVGQECVGTCRSRGSQDTKTKNNEK